MKRRDAFLAIAGLGVMPDALLAQQRGRMPVIGFLHPGSSGNVKGPVAAMEGLLAGLSSIGYIVGKTIRVESRWAEGRPESLPPLAQELVKLRVDLIVAVAPSAVKTAMAATRDIPIVAHDLETDPVAAGLIVSLPRPGGNLTGLFLNHADLAAKWLQQITEVKPGAKQIAVLSDANTGPYQLDAIKAAAGAAAVRLSVSEFREAAGIQSALDASLKARPDALVQLGSPLINGAAKAIADTLTARRVPAISPYRSFVENGGLMSYGVNLPVMYRSLAPYIDKILHGARAADLPIEQPTHFEFLVNLTAANAIGIRIPQSVLLRADEVIG